MASKVQTPAEFLDEILAEYGATELEVISDDDKWDIFDQDAQFALGISGEEFLRRWHMGELRDPDLHIRVQTVVSAFPLVLCEWPSRFDR